jgi:hypothetical protein
MDGTRNFLRHGMIVVVSLASIWALDLTLTGSDRATGTPPGNDAENLTSRSILAQFSPCPNGKCR